MENSSSGEQYPLDENNNTLYADGKWIPDDTPNLTRIDDGGCFGDGPGPINYTAGQLKLPSYKFFKKGALYEIMLEVRKDITRVSYAYIQVEIVKGTPPLMQITCGDPALCRKDEKGQVYINPTTRYCLKVMKEQTSFYFTNLKTNHDLFCKNIYFRLSLKAHCLEIDGSDCTPPMRYSWEMRRAGSSRKLQNSDAFFTTGKMYK